MQTPLTRELRADPRGPGRHCCQAPATTRQAPAVEEVFGNFSSCIFYTFPSLSHYAASEKQNPKASGMGEVLVITWANSSQRMVPGWAASAPFRNLLEPAVGPALGLLNVKFLGAGALGGSDTHASLRDPDLGCLPPFSLRPGGQKEHGSLSHAGSAAEPRSKASSHRRLGSVG